MSFKISSRITLVILCIILWTATNTKAQVSANKSDAVLKYSTDEEIVDVIYGEVEVLVKDAKELGVKGLEKREETEKISVKYPKVVVTKSEVRFLNEKGGNKNSVGLLKSIPGNSWSRVNKSKNEKFITINNLKKYNPKTENVEDAEMIMIDDDGKELWRTKHNLASIIPSPNGKYIVGTFDAAIGEAPIYVFNKNGLIKEIIKNSRTWNIGFSNDGSYFAVSIQTLDKDPEKTGYRRSDLIVFGMNGAELWRKNDIAQGTASDDVLIDFSNADIITVTTGWPEFKLYHFDKDGNSVQMD